MALCRFGLDFCLFNPLSFVEFMSEQLEKNDLKKDIIIYFSILLITSLIIFIHYLHLKLLGIALMVGLALTEAGILAYFFMHLMTKRRTIHLLLLLTAIAFVTLLFWPAWDIGYSPRTPSDYRIN